MLTTERVRDRLQPAGKKMRKPSLDLERQRSFFPFFPSNLVGLRKIFGKHLLRTDKVDAGLIARFCLAMHPELWVPAPPETRQLQAMVRRVDALLVMRTQELNRLGAAHETVHQSLKEHKEHIAYLDEQIDTIKRQIADRIKNDPNLRTKGDLLRSIPGMGKATTAMVLAELEPH